MMKILLRSSAWLVRATSVLMNNILTTLPVKRKKKQHAGMFEIAKMKNRPMITIGG
jgi:hypothetical protein